MNKAETNHNDRSRKHFSTSLSTEEEQPPPSSQPHFWHQPNAQSSSPPSREQLPTSPRRRHLVKPVSPLGAVNIVNVIGSIPPVQNGKRKHFTLESESPEKVGSNSPRFDDFDDQERQRKKRHIAHDDEVQLQPGSPLSHLSVERVLFLSAERLRKAEDILRANEEVINKSKKFRGELEDLKDKMTREEIDYVLG
ncbi:hypothetical protein BJ912DRAFT_1055530 [Pholiota molesta]|nr:hypothetical protein BJ912DRAFT_1055530 [Pholiota molesta]